MSTEYVDYLAKGSLEQPYGIVWCYRQRFYTKRDTTLFRHNRWGKTLQSSINALKDLVDFDVPTSIPISEPYSEMLDKMVQSNAMLCDQTEQKDIVNIVMKQVDDVLKTGGQAESTGNEKKDLIVK